MPVLSRKCDKAGYVPAFPNARALALAERACNAKSLVGVARVLRNEAARLPSGSEWVARLLRLAKGLTRGPLTHCVFSLKGNAKLPFASFSSLPVVDCPGAGECRDWCYSLTAWRHPDPFCRQLQNSLISRFAPELIRREWLRLPEGVVVRLFVDGDFRDFENVAWWMDRCQERPDLKVYGYSKSWEELWRYEQEGRAWPSNYTLNLSTGGRAQTVSLAQMQTLPIVRGRFISLAVDYRPPDQPVGNIGMKRYEDPAYHRAVRQAAEDAGLGRVLSCPGKCGACCGGNHACGGDPKFRQLTIAIGVH